MTQHLLFDIDELTLQQQHVHVRTPSGKFTTKSVKREFDKLRAQMVAMVRQRQSVWRKIREKDEEIKRLKEIIKSYESIQI